MKFNGYPIQIVKLKSTSYELDIKQGEYLYAYTPHGLGHNQRDAHNGSRIIGRLWVQDVNNSPRDQTATGAGLGTTEQAKVQEWTPQHTQHGI